MSYKTFIAHNVSTISSLESTLRSLTWFLPGRFKDADLVSEGLSALLNLTTMYHDSLLAAIIDNDPTYRPLVPISPHTRFTTACQQKHSLYKLLARALQLIKYTELLFEMGLRRKASYKTRTRAIVLLELVKAALRFTLLRITRKPLLSPPIPQRDFDPTTLPPPTIPSSPTLPPSDLQSSPPATPLHLKNNRSSLPPHALFTPSRSDSSPQDYLLSKAITTSSVKPSLSLVQSLSSPQHWLAEVIYILRPLVYASLLAFDNRSNRPLVTVLAMELFSRSLRRSPPPSAAIERAEYARRDRDMLWYLLRGSIWQQYTRPKLEAILARTANAPVLGSLGALLQNWILLIDEYYYYSAP